MVKGSKLDTLKYILKNFFFFTLFKNPLGRVEMILEGMNALISFYKLIY